MSLKKLTLTAILCTTLDQITKFWLFHKTPKTLIPGVLALIPVRNTGFSLGLFPDAVWPAIVLSVLLIGIIIVMLCRVKMRPFPAFCLSAVLGGAVGNLIDRIAFGYVRDFFDLLFIRFYVFNVADIMITVGIFMTCILLLTNREEHSFG